MLKVRVAMDGFDDPDGYTVAAYYAWGRVLLAGGEEVPAALCTPIDDDLVAKLRVISGGLAALEERQTWLLQELAAAHAEIDRLLGCIAALQGSTT
jgi:hypothetical protein